jgi:hypothetical protein
MFARPREAIEKIVEETIGRESRAATPEVPTSPPMAVTPPPEPPGSKAPEEPMKPPQRRTEAPIPPTADQVAIEEGRGGRLHRYLQGIIKGWAEKHEWRAHLEEPVLEGAGVVDVALRKGEISVGCEVGVTTTPVHEVDNVQKCLTAGFDFVILTSPDSRALKRYKRAVTDALPQDLLERVFVTSPEELTTTLESITEQADSTVHTIRGYKVRSRLKSLPRSETEARRKAVSRIIAKRLRHPKG